MTTCDPLPIGESASEVLGRLDSMIHLAQKDIILAERFLARTRERGDYGPLPGEYDWAYSPAAVARACGRLRVLKAQRSALLRAMETGRQ
jgi:hypothetical protein